MDLNHLRSASAVAGVLVATAFVGLCLILGVPPALDPGNAQLQFGIAVAISVAYILTPFFYATFRSSSNAEMPANLATVAVMCSLAALSILFTLLLFVGLGFKGFIISQIVMAAMAVMLWLGLLGMFGIARGVGHRQALTRNRRQSLASVLVDVELAVSRMPAQEVGDAISAIAKFREEVELLTPMQTDRNPKLMSRLWEVVEELRQAAAGKEGAKSVPEAVAAIKVTADALKRG